MSDKNKTSDEELNQFRSTRIKKNKTVWANMYAGETATNKRYDRANSLSSLSIAGINDIKDALRDALKNSDKLALFSEQLYATNILYANVINYLTNMFMWRYTVTPHKVYQKGGTGEVSPEDYRKSYDMMIEVVDGLCIENIFPRILRQLFIDGEVYFTTTADEDIKSVNTIILPRKYCRRIGETKYGTNIIEFNCQYFDNLGLANDNLKKFLEGFPKEIQTGYKAYKNNSNKKWCILDGRFSSCVLLNEYGIPTYFYLYGSIIDYEQYQTNELERNGNLLKYIVVQKMPVYQDKLVFEMDEVRDLHNSMKKIIDKKDKVRLMTTYGDVSLLKVGDDDAAQTDVLKKALQTVYDNAGLNPALFTGESVQALKMALTRDGQYVWNFVQQLLNFYTIAINNWFDFKPLQADIDILKISPYSYNDDIKTYRENAQLGVGKRDFFVASGTKQKNLEDTVALEDFLGLNSITPMQTSYTQTADDRSNESDSKTSTNEPSAANLEEENSGIEPSESNSSNK